MGPDYSDDPAGDPVEPDLIPDAVGCVFVILIVTAAMALLEWC